MTWAGPVAGDVPEIVQWLQEVAGAGATWAVSAWPESIEAVAEAAAAVRGPLSAWRDRFAPESEPAAGSVPSLSPSFGGARTNLTRWSFDGSTACPRTFSRTSRR